MQLVYEVFLFIQPLKSQNGSIKKNAVNRVIHPISSTSFSYFLFTLL